NVPEEKRDFSRKNAVVTSPEPPKPSAWEPAMKATRAFNPRPSGFSPGAEAGCNVLSSPASSLAAATRRTGRLAGERKVQCQSSGLLLAERRAGIARASAMVARVTSTMTRDPARKFTFSRQAVTKETALTLTWYLPGGRFSAE